MVGAGMCLWCGSEATWRAVLWRWPFTARYCPWCGQVTMTCHPWLEWLWECWLAPLWDERVTVYYGEDESAGG